MPGTGAGRVPVAVTGATGALGGAVARQLAARGVTQRLVVRDAARAPELARAQVAVATYDDLDAMRAAFTGAGTVFLVSAAEDEHRVDAHLTAVRAAAEAGVERVVYTSFQGASPTSTFTLGRDHAATEEALRASGLTVVVLRDNLYADFLPLLVGEGRAVRGPAGSGRLAAVARGDVATVAATVLLGALHGDDRHDGQTYTLTGPEALTLAEAAEAMTERLVAGGAAPVVFEDETVEQAYASRAASGAPQWQLDAWVSTYTAIAAGDLAEVTNDVEIVTGRPGRAFGALLDDEPGLLDALR